MTASMRFGWILLCGFIAATVSPFAATAQAKVSYYNDVRPILKRECYGCHNPNKLEGDLDMTTFELFAKGGDTDKTFEAGDPEHSFIIEQIEGEAATMPEDDDPLEPEVVAVIAQWIREGAIDDTVYEEAIPFADREPHVYGAPPVTSALAYSPDGEMLAISGFHEVILHKADGSAALARLIGESPRIESVAFSADGRLLVVSGGAPTQFGEIQIWDVQTNELVRSVMVSNDTLFGVSISPDAAHIAFGCADHSVRMIDTATGAESLRFKSHSDWVFGTTFTVDGSRLVSGSRDKAMKLIDWKSGQFVDDINKTVEGVLCLTRHPFEDIVAYGGIDGFARIYKISDNQQRTSANNDVNMLREFERQAGPVRAIAYAPDGESIALAGAPGEVRIYATGKVAADESRDKDADPYLLRTLGGHGGAVFAVAFHPEGKLLATGGFDGQVRVFDVATGEKVADFVPVTLETEPTAVAGGGL